VAFGVRDRLNVFDLANGRRTELADLTRVSSSGDYFGNSVFVRVLANNQVLVSTPMGSRFHLYTASGAPLRSFGTRASIPAGNYAPVFRISNVVDDRFWSVNSETYELEEWSTNGTRHSAMRREANWIGYQGWPSDGALGTVPTPMVADLRLSTDGTKLWVVVNVPSADWKSALGPAHAFKTGKLQYPERDFGRLYDSVVEVFDLSGGQLLHSTRVRGQIRFILSDAHVASLRDGADGSPVVEVWRVQLNANPNRRSK
jgi:hypothetical protein